MSVSTLQTSLVDRSALIRPARRAGSKARYAFTVLAFLLPSAIPLTLFVLGPMVAAAWVSLNEWNLIAPMRFIGLGNFADLLTDPATGAVFLHTVFYIAGYLPLVHPRDVEVWRHPLQWMLGPDLLVAPVLEPGATEWEVYLPPGDWVDAFTEERVPGGRVRHRSVPIDELPVYVRAAAWRGLEAVFADGHRSNCERLA